MNPVSVIYTGGGEGVEGEVGGGGRVLMSHLLRV